MPIPHIQGLFEQVRQHIIDAELPSAFVALRQLLAQRGESALDDDFLILQARYAKFKKAYLFEGTADREDENFYLLATHELAKLALAQALEKHNPAAAITAQAAPEDKLNQQLHQLFQNKLDTIFVPPNYSTDVSTNHKFAFCFPSHWSYAGYPQMQYCSIVDHETPLPHGIKRNLNLIIQDNARTHEVRMTPDEFSATTTQQIVASLATHFSNIEVISEQAIVFQGAPAYSRQLNYEIPQANGEAALYSLYQQQFFSRNFDQLFTLSFTTHQADFIKMKLVFDNILQTFVF